MISSAGLTNLGRYRWLVLSLRQARERGDEEHEDFIEEKLIQLWDMLTERERKEAESFAELAFP